MKTMPILFLPAVLSVSIALATGAEACTIGVADGSVSIDGRGLLWQSAMSETGSFIPCVVVRIEGGGGPGRSYSYVGISYVGYDDPMAGLNAAGLSTLNSYVPFDPDGWGTSNNLPPIKTALESCTSVDHVRSYLEGEFQGGWTKFVTGCFPYLDASGEATMFEIARDKWMIEYSSQDPDRDPQNLLGWVVRANEFHQHADGTDDVMIVGRYHSGSMNIQGLVSMVDDLSVKTVMQGNMGSNGYEFMRYGPNRSMATIAAPSVVYSMAVRGVAPGEDPALATMWAMLGQSNYSISVPIWVRVANVPECLANGDMAFRAESLRLKGQEPTTQASVLPAEEHLFDEVDQLLAHWRSAGTPSAEEMTRVEHRMAADAYSLLDCLDNLQDDNKAPTVVLQGTRVSGLTMDFAASANDIDGLIRGYEWVFGDGFESAEQSPLHAFDAPGWYLVSCTVSDDDGVSTTDWEHIYVVPEPSTLLLLDTLALLAAAQYGWRRRKRWIPI